MGQRYDFLENGEQCSYLTISTVQPILSALLILSNIFFLSIVLLWVCTYKPGATFRGTRPFLGVSVVDTMLKLENINPKALTFCKPASIMAVVNVDAASCSCNMEPSFLVTQSPVLGAMFVLLTLLGPTSLWTASGSASRRFALISAGMFVLRLNATLTGSPGW